MNKVCSFDFGLETPRSIAVVFFVVVAISLLSVLSVFLFLLLFLLFVSHLFVDLPLRAIVDIYSIQLGEHLVAAQSQEKISSEHTKRLCTTSQQHFVHHHTITDGKIMGDHFNDHFNVWITIRVTVSLLPLPLPFEFIASIAISSFVFVIHLFTQYQKPARQYQIIEVTTVTRPVFAASQIKTNGNSVCVCFFFRR